MVARCCSVGDSEHFVAVVVVVAADHGRDALDIFPRFRRSRENLKPHWQHLGLVDPDLPGAALVCKEDDIVIAFIDMVGRPKRISMASRSSTRSLPFALIA